MIPPDQRTQSDSLARGQSGGGPPHSKTRARRRARSTARQHFGVRPASGVFPAASRRNSRDSFSNSPPTISPRKILARVLLAFIFTFFSAHHSPAASSNSPASATNHWAFQPLQRPAIPRLADAPAPNPIDAFIRAALAANQLAPAPPADPRTLLRRLSFTLLGLPPTPAEVEAFTAECRSGSSFVLRPSSVSALIERLLSSPHFGERWARHWLDVVRYADTHGTEHDAWLPHAWRYRDYLVRAFNADLPSDQFLREHVAGDLLAPPRWNQSLGLNESLLGSAWWRLVEFNQTPVDVKGEEVLVVDSQIDAYSKAFLGLTVSCARCHDHKVDPISQRDFHGLYSILASTRTAMRVLDPPEFLTAKNAKLAKLKSAIRVALAARWREQIELWPAALASARDAAAASVNPANEKPPAELARAGARWRAAFAVAETNKAPLAPLLRALRDEGREISPRDSGAEKSADAHVPVFADFSSGASCGWFGTGGFAQPARAGEFSLHTSGTNTLAAIYPAGRYSHLLSDKHAGTLRSPNFLVTNKFISALVTGDHNARLRLVLENFQGDSLLFTQITPKLNDRTALRWLTLPVRETWLGRRAYLELTPRDDFPYLGIVKDAAKLPTEGRSAAGIARVIFHNGEPLPPPPAWPDELTIALDSARTLAQLPTPNSPTRPSFAARKGIFMIDASKGFMKDGPKNRLREQDIHKIVDTFTRQAEVPRYARMVSVAEISDPKNDFNLNLPRYIDSTEPEDIQDIAGHLRGGIPERDLDALARYWQVIPAVRAALFKKADRPGYSALRIPQSEIKSAIFAHPEFTAFNDTAIKLFAKWKKVHTPLLRSVAIGDKPKALIETLSEDLLAAFAQAPLLDHYDIYQHLMDYWAETMQDDCYLIAADGWREAAKPRLVVEDKSKKAIKEKPDFTVGKKKYQTELIPSALVIARYFAKEQAAIEKLETDIAAHQQQMEELAEEHGGEEGAFAVLEKIHRAEIVRRLKEIENEESAGDESKSLKLADAPVPLRDGEKTETEILLTWLNLDTQTTELNRKLKAAQESLMEHVLQQYGKLTEDDIKTLVVDDKWLATLAAAVQGELDRVSQTLTGRIRQLAERYATPLPQLTNEVAALSAKVAGHLKKMGFQP